MKAVLYRLPAKNVLVLEDNDGKLHVEFPSSETRGHQIAQDAGHQHLQFGRIEELVRNGWKKQPIKMQ